MLVTEAPRQRQEDGGFKAIGRHIVRCHLQMKRLSCLSTDRLSVYLPSVCLMSTFVTEAHGLFHSAESASPEGH